VFDRAGVTAIGCGLDKAAFHTIIAIIIYPFKRVSTNQAVELGDLAFIRDL
jgi:hypothetical protein